MLPKEFEMTNSSTRHIPLIFLEFTNRQQTTKCQRKDDDEELVADHEGRAMSYGNVHSLGVNLSAAYNSKPRLVTLHEFVCCPRSWMMDDGHTSVSCYGLLNFMKNC